MKKVLLGLVIAVMMTGSGYALEFMDDCDYLKEQALGYVEGAHFNNRIIKTKQSMLSKPSENYDFSEIEELRKQELETIKEAHYFAVTWSALCD